MSIELVRNYFKNFGLEEKIQEFDVSSATVELAAKAVGVIPSRIAKSLSFILNDRCLIIVVSGDAKIDNQKFKHKFSGKPKMIKTEQVEELTGFKPGGVCPFVANQTVEIYLDDSLKRFSTVFPACGSSNSAIELTPYEIFEYSHAKEWVDVCKDWDEHLNALN